MEYVRQNALSVFVSEVADSSVSLATVGDSVGEEESIFVLSE